MKLDRNGVNLIAEFEGLILTPYYATALEKQKGIVTIATLLPAITTILSNWEMLYYRNLFSTEAHAYYLL